MFSLTTAPQSRRAIDKINRIDRDIARGIRQGFFRVGDQLTDRLNSDILKKPKTGRVYRIRRGSTIRNHRSSAKGETPANLSGTLRRSRGYQIRGAAQLEFGYRRGKGAYYAPFLEDPNGLNRPGLLNAITAEEGRTQSIFLNELRRALS